MSNQSPGSGTLEFFREVTKYFMDFLETDFHKRKLPRRAIKSRNADNLLVGINLRKYESFSLLISKIIQKGFPADPILQLRKGQHKTKLPKNVFSLIELQVSKINKAQFQDLISEVALRVEQEAVLNREDYEQALNSTLEAAGVAFYSEMIHPFIISLEKPLTNNELGDKDDIFMLEQELVAIFVKEIEDKIAEIIRRLIAKENFEILEEITSSITLEGLKATLVEHFENLRVADLFHDVQELENNKSILDKQDLYLYFGDISYKNNKYPIFYIPLAITKDGDSYEIQFDSQVYINKKSLEFVAQEFNVSHGTKGTLKSVSERIIYISEHKDQLEVVLGQIIQEIQNFFELKGNIDLSQNTELQARSPEVTLTNSLNFALFDKSDEALVNDYEEILADLSLDGGELADAFNQILADFLQKNPEAVGPEIEQEWDDTNTAERLVAVSPIPLNSEQLQILKAVEKPNCKYIIVEGPPGTGKSHTITAIVFEQILNGKSVLVLSDKKEALDVVEKNITETMNKVRFDQNFQNPILRLGKTGNTYSQILSKTSITEIKDHYRAVKKDIEDINENIVNSASLLKQDIELESLAYNDVQISEISEFVQLEAEIKKESFIFDLDEVLANPQGGYEIASLRESLVAFALIQKSRNFAQIPKLMSVSIPASFDQYSEIIESLNDVSKIIKDARENLGYLLKSLSMFGSFRADQLPKLLGFLGEYAACKKPLVGYAFSKGKLALIDDRFTAEFSYSGTAPSAEISWLRNFYDAMLSFKKSSDSLNSKNGTSFDYVALIHQIMTSEEMQDWIEESGEALEASTLLSNIASDYPKSLIKLKIDLGKIDTLSENKLLSTEEAVFDRQVRYVQLQQKIRKEFQDIPEIDYAFRKRNIEQLVITKVTHQLDGRLVNFYDNNKNDAETLKTIIKSKQKFPREQFVKLNNAFPCILSGIRDFAEYIPLHQQMFDLLIIDEASQVSLAQAFPALIRAKKVLILGDKKQFSNIKAAQARSDTNREYLSRLEGSFKRNVSTEASQLIRLGKFNIKTSVLDFFEFISNYNMQLIKHFRGYKEIISYSNKYFYNDGLQVMKIRAKPITEVLKFDYVKPSAKSELYPNTNLAEVDFIIKELLRLKAEKNTMSVGIITPHTNQQKLLVEQIGKLPERDYFLNQFDLKVMTFDTCQGEERDLVFYSMVASDYSDKLWGVFIKDLANVDIEEDGQIKAQRLNVGFSRGKECLHFVLSKPLDQFTGSIGEALRHYAFELEEAKKERLASETDPKSKMEPEVLSWFYQTSFWKKNKERATFVPQFEIGKYLKQLDRSYTHPMYKVDFLLAVTGDDGKERKIVIEYDGFYEHFKNLDFVNEYNYESYLSDGDVYRQKVLESYGYKFLRINRFNAGENPIEMLDKRLAAFTKAEPRIDPMMYKIHETIEGLQAGDVRECPKCKELRTSEEFRDPNLSTGVGKICMVCKTSAPTIRPTVRRGGSYGVGKLCPKCNSRMVLRTSHRGKFYGCSRYPYCKGIRST
jgi:superfamily I DNA and/or RNA helicase